MKTKKEIERLLVSIDEEILSIEKEYTICLSSQESLANLLDVNRKLCELRGEREAYKKILGLNEYVTLIDGTIVKRHNKKGVVLDIGHNKLFLP